MSRGFLASAVVNLVLMAAVAFLLIGRGELTARIDELERAAERVEEIRAEEAKTIAALQMRNGALLTAQAEACGVEGTTAFDRGVRTGMAVCQARQPQ
jgi:hypothetical protein